MKKKQSNSALQFEKEILDFCTRHNISKSSSILIAFSGGSDSLSLAIALKKMRFENFSTLYVNHNLRSKDELEKEIELNRHNAAALDIPFEIISLDRSKIDLLSKRLGLEASCRKLRYEAIDKYAAANDFDYVFTGHNQTDCDEEDIIKFFRGQSEFSGIKEKNGKIYRPLLNIPHSLTEKYVLENNFTYSIDSTNFDNIHLRSQIRLKLNNVLEEIFPSFSKSFAERRKLTASQDFKSTLYSAYRLLNLNNSNNSRVSLRDVNSIVEFAEKGNNTGKMEYCDSIIFRLPNNIEQKNMVISKKGVLSFDWQTTVSDDDIKSGQISFPNGEKYLIFSIEKQSGEQDICSQLPKEALFLVDYKNVVFASFSPQDKMTKSSKDEKIKEFFKSSSIPSPIQKMVMVVKEEDKIIAVLLNIVGKKNYISDEYKLKTREARKGYVFLRISSPFS